MPLEDVRRTIVKTASAAGRDPGTIELVAVSKTFDAPDIEPLLDAGQRVFGENRVQEAARKWPALRMRYPDIVLHLIGPLQTNKVAEAVALFDVIETIDREKVARAVAAEMRKQTKATRLFIQVNIGEEPQKAGIPPADADAFIALCRDGLGLGIDGLMCIPPAGDDPAPYFTRLANLAGRNRIAALSMGMSADYPLAIALGATYVRVGSAIFGSRPQRPA
jgi:pyridoxal phosphate enzyme (YggS family)